MKNSIILLSSEKFYKIMIQENTLLCISLLFKKYKIKRAFGEDYSLSSIKERIYYKSKEKLPIANLIKKYYRKVYKGIKISNYLLFC